jgi:hypothetical protein
MSTVTRSLAVALLAAWGVTELAVVVRPLIPVLAVALVVSLVGSLLLRRRRNW